MTTSNFHRALLRDNVDKSPEDRGIVPGAEVSLFVQSGLASEVSYNPNPDIILIGHATVADPPSGGFQTAIHGHDLSDGFVALCKFSLSAGSTKIPYPYTYHHGDELPATCSALVGEARFAWHLKAMTPRAKAPRSSCHKDLPVQEPLTLESVEAARLHFHALTQAPVPDAEMDPVDSPKAPSPPLADVDNLPPPASTRTPSPLPPSNTPRPSVQVTEEDSDDEDVILPVTSPAPPVTGMRILDLCGSEEEDTVTASKSAGRKQVSRGLESQETVEDILTGTPDNDDAKGHRLEMTKFDFAVYDKLEILVSVRQLLPPELPLRPVSDNHLLELREEMEKVQFDYTRGFILVTPPPHVATFAVMYTITVAKTGRGSMS